MKGILSILSNVINNIKKAIIVADQVPFTKGILIDLKKANYEAAVKPYMKENKDLLDELKGKVNLQFEGILKGGKKIHSIKSTRIKQGI